MASFSRSHAYLYPNIGLLYIESKHRIDPRSQI